MHRTLSRWFHQSLILFVILAAAWLRLWQLNSLPPGFWYDEAYNAMDAIWMLDTHSPKMLFIHDNNANEPAIHYLGALSMGILGAKPYTFRLVPVLVGILTIALMYRWLITFFADHSDRRWLALLAAAGLAFSFWHVAMSRIGFRVFLFPLIVILTTYLFWYGWQNRSLIHFALAGVALGVGQYTYLPARLLPLVFGCFALASFILIKKQPVVHKDIRNVPQKGIHQNQDLGHRNRFALASLYFYTASSQKTLWLGLLVMIVISLIVFLPLGLFFFYHPTAFSARTSRVFIWGDIGNIRDLIPLGEHLLGGFRVFVDGYDQNWRHDLPGRPSLGQFSIAGFWISWFVVFRNLRKPNYLFLLIGLLVLWVPALMSDQAIHALRLSGLLPIYYALMSVGLIAFARLLAKWLPRRIPAYTVKLTMFLLVLIFLGGTTTYDYFVRWANEPMVYQEHNGPLADLTRYLIHESYSTDILLPFRVYSQPTVRLLLYDEFQETNVTPTYDPHRPALLVTSNSALAERLSRVKTSSYVWLTRDATGHGIAYVSRQPWPEDLTELPTGQTTPFNNPHTGETVAQLTQLENVGPVLGLFTDWPPSLNLVNYKWGQLFGLIGYQLSPESVQPGQKLHLNLYWQLLSSANDWNYDIRIEIVDAQGTLIEKSGISAKELFRWRRHGFISSQRSIEIEPETMPGPHLIRISFVGRDGQRLPVYTSDNKLLGNQAVVGEFYISESDTH